MGRGILLLALLFVLAFAAAESFPFTEKDLASEESLWELYERWRSHHTVSRDLDEKHKRFNVFKENVKFIHEFNKKDKPYKLRLNKFGDMTKDEFRRTFAGSRISHHRALRGSPRGAGGFMHEKIKDLPPSVDWRQKGAVTPVKDQGQCGIMLDTYFCRKCFSLYILIYVVNLHLFEYVICAQGAAGHSQLLSLWRA